MTQAAPSVELRIGQGLDLHQLVEGRPLILGGVTIPYELGLLGHSDADVLLHALVDALLGAAGLSDIGTFFPNTDVQWKDCNSMEFVKVVWSKLSADGWKIVNVDSTVLAQAPKIAPFIPEMKNKICGALGIESSRLGIKATTTESLGAIGRGEGMAAMCVVLLSK